MHSSEETTIKFNKKCLQINSVLRNGFALQGLEHWCLHTSLINMQVGGRGRGLACAVQIRDKSVWLHLCQPALLLTLQSMADSLTHSNTRAWNCKNLMSLLLIWWRKRKRFHLMLKVFFCTMKCCPNSSTQKAEFHFPFYVLFKTVKVECWKGEVQVKEWPRTLNFRHHYRLNWLSDTFSQMQCLQIHVVTAV